ncbi:hypothetical protein AAC387_Pa02g4838 [Persea americana]
MATDALVSVVVGDLYSIAKDGLSSLFGVKNEVDELSSTFSAIQAVLEDAERHQVTNMPVRDWLLELKEVAYEVEDILDEWVTDAFISQEDKDETRHPKRVRLSFLSPYQYFKQVKLQYDIGQRIRETTKRLSEISIKKEKFNLRELNTREDMLVPNKEERQTGSLVDESEIFGRDDFKKSIIEQLVSETSQEEKSVSVISIVGMGGLGKTTLAQLIYSDDSVMAHFEKRIWVCVSDPFDVNRIAIKVIESVGGCGSASNNPDLDTLQRNLREAIDKKKFLLVLDDVWDENGRLWQKLRVPLMAAASGSKVVVTTRSRQVAESMETTLIHKLGVLSESDCWKLFKYKALRGTEDEECRELIEIGEKIVKRCKGIPLAVRALGSLLRCRRTKWYWERVLESEIWEWDVPKDDGILPALLLSYYSLPLHLRRCFSFCSVFPKDHGIKKDKLVKLWMANGIIKSEQAKKDDIEEIGEMYFDDLLTRSLFQDAVKDNDGNMSDEEWRTVGDDEMERMKSLLEGLRPPHSNLKELQINNYAGAKFPNWLEDSKFSSLVRVILVYCRKCILLPGLGKLHSLKYLTIYGADEVKVVGCEFYGIVNDAGAKETRFPKLEELCFQSMPKWEEWKLTQEYGKERTGAKYPTSHALRLMAKNLRRSRRNGDTISNFKLAFEISTTAVHQGVWETSLEVEWETSMF